MTQKPTYEELEQRIKELNREITTHKRPELERLAHLSFLKIMDKIDQVIRGTDDFGTIMRDIFETVLTIFQCDRVWLMYPCDPEADFWRVPMECARPEYPGAFALNQDMPMTSEMVESLNAVLKSKGPLVFHPEHGLPLPDSAKRFSIQSSINSALYPKVGKPWMWGLSQCSHPRQWTEAEISIFQETGRRISDSLSILLTLRNLKDSEEKYRSMVESMKAGVYICSSDFRVEYMNPAMIKMIGRDGTGEVCYNAISGLDEQCPWCVHDKIQQGESAETEILDPRDKYYYNVSNSPIFHQDGSISKMTIYRDRTESKRAEEERIRLATAVEHAAESVIIANRPGTIQYVNPSFQRLSGYTKEEIVGQNFRILKSDKHGEHFYKKMWDIISKGNVWAGRITNRIKDGTFREFETRISPVRDSAGEIINFVSVNRDVTQEVALEAKLQRAQKMEALGLLAGGVAHDLNNVLSGIVSYPELMLLDLPKDSKLRKPIETMQASGHRAAAIVQDLLTVARGVAITKEPLNLNDLAGDYLNSPEFKKLAHFHPSVTVNANLDSDLFNVSGSHVHIRKVVMNLVSNASEAIEGRGNVTISTMNRYVDRPLRGYDDVTMGEYAVMSVSDDGSGISSVDLERIFEPFYTKKVMGKSGTGLGLAVVWNVVQDHKGYINVASNEDGTTFELYFPITREEISGKDLGIPIGDFKGDGETILVVDDVESQREIACEMLNKLGYKAKAVSSGEEAVEYLTEYTVDLVLLDMIMDPGISGRQTYGQIIKTHPNQKAIIASGFAETEDVKETQKLGAGQYIKKPLTLEKMGTAVRDELKK